MTHVELVRVLSREWPKEADRWWDNVERLFEIPNETRIDIDIEGNWVMIPTQSEIWSFARGGRE